MNIKKISIVILAVFMILSLGVSTVRAIEDLQLGCEVELGISGYLKNETYIRAWHGPDDIMSCRNVFNLDLDFSFPGIPIVRRMFIELRPVYDAVFDWENEGTGGGTSKLRKRFQDNFGVADDWDPLLRECWVDLSIGKLDARLGKQLVSWGKSDGIWMLDLINPFNWRNPSVFEEEDTKIPLWMVNLEYHVKPMQTLQFLFIPRYVPAMNPFDGHDWAANITTWVEDYDAFLSLPQSAWGPGANIKTREPGTSLSNAEYGLRWSGWWKGISYTLNYFYTWDDYLNQYPTGAWWDYGTAVGMGYPYFVNTEYTYRADRLSIFGGSFDYCWDYFLGLKQVVTRAEFAYLKNDVWYNYDVGLEEKDNIGVLLGFDKYFFIDYWTSIQVQASYILDAHGHDSYYDLGSGYHGADAAGLGSGMRDALELNYTLYVMKDYLPGDTLHTEWFLMYDDDGAFWFRPKVKYDVSDQFHVSLGANLFWGKEDDPFVGESRNNDNLFVEFLWGF
ncbi:MAG: hypothetical protein JRI49_01010 [Deltaproteobacteria bacterium]|nr:hypothetical protein [Deltaproteobacteria bacterium]